jgi:hypothetical protein
MEGLTMNEKIEMILKVMDEDIKRIEKEINDSDSMKDYHRGEINTLKRYIKFIKEPLI